MLDELIGFFETYAERYMAGDAEAIAGSSEVPFLAVRRGVVHHLPDRAALLDHLRTNMSAYRESGAQSADIASIDVEGLGSAAARVTVQWHVRSATGDLLRDFLTTYQLVAGPWRIVSYVNHDVIEGGAT